MRKVTIHDVAARVRVSKSTVSAVLSGRGAALRISPRTQQAVLDAAAELGYRPNAFARATRTGRFGAVCMALSNMPDCARLQPAMLDVLTAALEERGLTLTLSRLTAAQLEDDRHVPGFLREGRVDGILVNHPESLPPRLVGLIARHSLPTVWINARHDRDCVHPDDRGAGRAATQRALDLGHRRIAFAKLSHTTHASAAERAAGYKDAMRAAGLRPAMSRPLRNGDGAARVAQTARWIASLKERPTAIVCGESYETLAVLMALASLGLKVPADASVVAITGHGSEAHALGAAGVLIPEAAVGRAAVEMLARKITHPAEPHPPRVVPCDGFQDGHTLAAPRGA